MLRNTTPTDIEIRKYPVSLLSIFKPVKHVDDSFDEVKRLNERRESRQELKSSPLTTTPSPSLDLLK